MATQTHPLEAVFDNPIPAKPAVQTVEIARLTPEGVLAVGNPACTSGAERGDIVVPWGARVRWATAAGTSVSEPITGPQNERK